MKCCICGKEIVGYGNSPSPLAGNKCCDECNAKVVMPVRLFLNTLQTQNYAMLIKEHEVVLVKPDNKYFTLKELQTAVEGYIEILPSCFTSYLDVVNEEGRLNGLYFNKLAYLLFDRDYVGNVLVCPVKIFESPEED